MKTVSVKSIEDAIYFFNEGKEEEIEKFNSEICEKYPELVNMALEISNAFYQKEEDVKEGVFILLYYMCLFFKAFELEGCEIKHIQEEYIEEFNEKMQGFIEEYYEEGDANLIVEFTNQVNLSHFLLQEISEENEVCDYNDDQANMVFMAGVSYLHLLHYSQN